MLLRLRNGAAVGTRLNASASPLDARKTWLAGHLKTNGTLVLDAGATKALQQSGKSLLPVGVTRVEGAFSRGDVVSVANAQGVEIARGLDNYAAFEAKLIAGKPSIEIAGLLGYMAEAELIHRDNLLLMKAN